MDAVDVAASTSNVHEAGSMTSPSNIHAPHSTTLTSDMHESDLTASTSVLQISPTLETEAPPPSRKITTLSDLPNEVVAQIFSNVGGQSRKSVSLVSKRYGEIVRPYMYRFISCLKTQNWHALFRTLLRRPELALYVQYFGVQESEFTASGCPNTNQPANQPNVKPWMLSNDDQKLADRLLADSKIYDASFIQQSDHMEVRIALILSLCSNLKNFWIYRSDSGSFITCRERFRNQFVNILNRLEGLHKVELRGEWDFTETWPTDSVTLPLFYHRNIKILEITGLVKKGSLKWPRERPCASSLTSLTLGCSAVSGSALGELLQACPNLKHLSYTYQVDLAEDGFQYDFDLIDEALSHVKMTLEHLDLDFDLEDPWSEIEDFGIIGTIDLHDFPKLETVHVPIVGLLGTRPRTPEEGGELAGVLPKSLQSLYVRDTLQWLDPAKYWEDAEYVWLPWALAARLKKYVSHKNSQRLETIWISDDLGRYANIWSDSMAVQELKTACDEFKVKLFVNGRERNYP